MDMCTRRLTKELKALQKDPIQDPRIIVAPNERNLLEMHYVIEGSKGTPFEGGVYHGKLIFPKEYPLKPPSVIMLTPSGRFQPGRRLCLSMSDFHPESWNPMYVLLAEGSASVPPADGSDWGTWRVCPSWSVSTILTGLYSFMIEANPTLGSIETSQRKKRHLASLSLKYNVEHDATFGKLFPEYVERYELEQSQQPMDASPTVTTGVAAHRHDAGLPQGMAATVAGLVAILSIVLVYRFS